MAKETIRLYFQQGISDNYKSIVFNKFKEANNIFGNYFNVVRDKDGDKIITKEFFDDYRIDVPEQGSKKKVKRVDSYKILADNFWRPEDDGTNHVMIFTLEDLCATDQKGNIVASQNYGNNVGDHSIISTYMPDKIHAGKQNSEVLSALTSSAIGIHEMGHYCKACTRSHKVKPDFTNTPHCDDLECIMSQGEIDKFANNVYHSLEREDLMGVGFCPTCRDEIKEYINKKSK